MGCPHMAQGKGAWEVVPSSLEELTQALGSFERGNFPPPSLDICKDLPLGWRENAGVQAGGPQPAVLPPLHPGHLLSPLSSPWAVSE